jgi:signal transduction histidine kinase
MEKRQIIQNSIISDMSEGVMAIRFDGRIILVNDAGLEILCRQREELEDRTFASCFFADEGNEAFTDCVLDVIYKKGRRQERYVP